MPDTGPTFSLVPSYFVQNGDTLLPVQHNPVFEDIATALTNRVTRDGAGNMTGDLDMSGHKVVGLAAATSPSDAVILAQIKDVAYLNIAQTWTAAQTFTGGIDAVGDTSGSRMRFQRTGSEVFYLSGLPGEFRIGNETDGINLVRFLPGDTRFSDPISSPGGTASGQHRNNGQNDAIFAQKSIAVSAGSGLSGGGDLSANRSIALDGTDTRNVSHSGVSISAGDGLTGGGTIAASRSLAVDSTVARTSRTISAGDGLSGGGSLAADRAFSVDGTVVRTSGNQSIAGTKNFTGALQAGGQAVLTSVSAADVIPAGRGSVGAYGFLAISSSLNAWNSGATKAGSELVYSSAQNSTGTVPSGSWVNMGGTVSTTGDATLGVRIL